VVRRFIATDYLLRILKNIARSPECPGLPLFSQHGFSVELKNLVSDAERRLQRFEMDSRLLRKTRATIGCTSSLHCVQNR
jgi:hypothetical protein